MHPLLIFVRMYFWRCQKLCIFKDVKAQVHVAFFSARTLCVCVHVCVCVCVCVCLRAHVRERMQTCVHTHGSVFVQTSWYDKGQRLCNCIPWDTVCNLQRIFSVSIGLLHILEEGKGMWLPTVWGCSLFVFCHTTVNARAVLWLWPF